MPKKMTPAPIDRPLSRAYLRQFTGWSTAYPPGISDPTSLRLMANLLVQRDGSISIRPGIKYLSYLSAGVPTDQEIVGTHEPFFLNNGNKAYLLAVREDDDTVGFRVLGDTGDGFYLHGLTDEGVGFTITQGETALHFTAATTYVKYLQIDNKIYALSNAGETLRLFYVGTGKVAKKLNSIVRPNWDPIDKLVVVQPNEAWIESGVATSTRVNLIGNPSYELADSDWNGFGSTTLKHTAVAALTPGTKSIRTFCDSGDPVNIYYKVIPVVAGQDYAFSIYTRAATVVHDWHAIILWLDAGGLALAQDDGSTVTSSNASWSRLEVTGTAPTGATQVLVSVLQDDLAGGSSEEHYFDHALFEQASAVDTYFDGSFADTSTVIYKWTGAAEFSTSLRQEIAAPAALPTAITPTADTLISTDATKNVYNFGFFYTFANEVGESAPSQITVVKVQRGWSQWTWLTADSGDAADATTVYPDLAADQLVAYMPESVFTDAMAQGATKWNLYAVTWSDQDPVPVSGVRLATKVLTPSSLHPSSGYLRMTPQQADANAEIANLPSENNRFNFSTPSSAGNGIVAADRMVLVFDPAAAAVIRWSSAEMGNYADFTANKGGGYKTLSSGNLYVPASVVLWQNPQSVDTITILCMGVDGRSTGYYMAPAQIASQSEAVNIMGFEETTATPGTTSPYGVEVLNNALYHPLDDQLMKSSATNYNINHLALTDTIQDVWRKLVDKERIVSSVTDNRIYYLVHNPQGETLEDGCWGNEVWIFDANQKAGSWSRWLCQAQSLRRVDVDGRPRMSFTRPDGIFYFDDDTLTDDYVSGVEVAQRNIPWYLETNTQGANRAHDAWAHVQQVNIIAGNFLGTMRYGIRALDIHGKMLNIAKVVRDFNAPSTDGTTWDLQDFLLVRKDLQEWFFFASSIDDGEGGVLASSGQLNLVQYRYTPSTVNTGYEQGSVETFEYGRAGNAEADRNTVNGVPMPFIDTGRP